VTDGVRQNGHLIPLDNQHLKEKKKKDMPDPHLVLEWPMNQLDTLYARFTTDPRTARAKLFFLPST
jgi:predicted nucleotidyltransferase